MKLLWIANAPIDIPGYRSTQFGMAIALEKLGWDVHLIGKSNSTKAFVKFPGFQGKVTLVQRKGRLSTELNHHLTIWRILYGKRYDVVLFEQPHLRLVMLPAILSLLKVIKTCFILDIRSPLLDNSRNSRIERLNYWLTMKFAKWCLPGITVITDELRKDLKPLLGVKKPVAVWSSGVDPELFDPLNVQPVPRSKFGLENRFVFLYHGALTLSRGLSQLISAMSKLRVEHPEAALVLLGDGPGVNELRRQTLELKLEDTIYFLDTVPNTDVPKYIAMADVGVIPLPNERCWQVSSPLKLFEYMAMELPLVVSDIEAHRTVLGASPYTIYVKEVTPIGICEAMEKAIGDILKLRKNAFLSREQVMNKHSWMNQGQKFALFIDNILHTLI